MTVWLPVIGAVIGLAGIVIGWSLTQLGQWFALRRERKKTMARAIYGMLQIRNRVQIIPDAVRMVGEKLQIPAGGQVVLTAVFENFGTP